MRYKLFSWFILSLLLVGISSCKNENTNSMIVKQYGTIDGVEVLQYSIQNKSGMVVKIINYGATITDIMVPDKDGKYGNVVLGFDGLKGYIQSDNPYFGATIGRYANRISKAMFSIDGQQYNLAPNNNGNTLHGGIKGFNRVIWQANAINDSTLSMSYKSADGEEGFPGNLSTEVKFTITNQNEIIIEYSATTDKATPVNLTNHSYFNLSANGSATILDHQLKINAKSITPVDESLIPTGAITSILNSPFDFTDTKRIGDEIDSIAGGGYDHNYVLNDASDELALAAVLFDPVSGRQLMLYTTEPGLQFYSGNFLDGTLKGNSANIFIKHAGLCLEPQHFPDSPNQPDFPNTILKPGERYIQKSVFSFSIH